MQNNMKDAVKDAIEELTKDDPKKTQQEGFTEHGAFRTKEEYPKQVCAPDGLEVVDDPDADPPAARQGTPLPMPCPAMLCPAVS